MERPNSGAGPSGDLPENCPGIGSVREQIHKKEQKLNKRGETSHRTSNQGKTGKRNKGSEMLTRGAPSLHHSLAHVKSQTEKLPAVVERAGCED